MSADSPIDDYCYREMNPFEWNQTTDQLFHKGTAVQTQGRWVVGVSPAPQGDWVAVLSIDGRRTDAIGLPGLGKGGSYTGRYFHELRRLSTGDRVGKPVHLADANGLGGLAVAHWTGDGSYTIYTTHSCGSVWIVPNVMVDAKEFEK